MLLYTILHHIPGNIVCMYLLYATFHVNLCSRALFNLISNLHRRLTTLQICHATLKQASAAGLTTL